MRLGCCRGSNPEPAVQLRLGRHGEPWTPEPVSYLPLNNPRNLLIAGNATQIIKTVYVYHNT
jgi:hypothetical protein